MMQELEKVYASYGAKKLPDLTSLTKVYDEQSKLATP